MASNWSKVGGLIVAGLLAGSSLLGGCGVNEKDYQALQTENQDLRAKNVQLENENKAKDTELAKAREQQSATIPLSDSADYPNGPKPVKPPKNGNDVVLEVSGDVLFDSGQTTIKSSAKKELDKIASQLNGKYSGHRIRIEGHTDSDPIRKNKQYKTNEALSEARASAVRDYLASKGVARNRFSVVGKGSSEPKGSKKESRRVDVIVLAN